MVGLKKGDILLFCRKVECPLFLIDVSAENPEVVKRMKGRFDELTAQSQSQSQSRRDASQ